MKKAILYIALTIGGVCLVVAAYYCHFYYAQYHNVVTELESRAIRSTNVLPTSKPQITRADSNARVGGHLHNRQAPLLKDLFRSISFERQSIPHIPFANCQIKYAPTAHEISTMIRLLNNIALASSSVK